MSAPSHIQRAFNALEETTTDMRAMATLLMLMAVDTDNRGAVLSFLGRQLDDWREKIDAAHELLRRGGDA